MPKYCPECGSLMDDYSDFCRECGARSSTHHKGYVPWSAKKSINSHNHSKKVFHQNSNSNSSSKKQRLTDNDKSKKMRLPKLLPTFIGLLSIILIFCVISGNLLNFDNSNKTQSSTINSTNNSSSNNSLITDNNSSNNIINNSSSNKNNKTYLLINYEGPWRGSVGTTDNLRDYNGNHSKKIEFINMGPNEFITANIQKQDSTEGLLIVQLIKNGTIIKESKTTTPYGVVTVSE